MDKSRQKGPKIQTSCTSEEVSSIEWEAIAMSEEEEDMIKRMHKLVGDRWGLIAGRVPGRKAEEIERYWLMTNNHNLKDDDNNRSTKTTPSKYNNKGRN